MMEKKFQFLSLISVPSNKRRDLLTCIFYQAEAEAFERSIIKKTFAEVGLSPWNPERIMQLCKEHCSSLGELKQGPLVKKLLSIINKVKQDKEEQLSQILSGVKRASVEIVRKGALEKGSGEENEDHLEDDEQEEEEDCEDKKDEGSVTKPAAKRQRRTRCI